MKLQGGVEVWLTYP